MYIISEVIFPFILINEMYGRKINFNKLVISRIFTNQIKNDLLSFFYFHLS